MKRIAKTAFLLFLACIFLFLSVPVNAASATATFTVGDAVYGTQTAVDGNVTLPSAPSGVEGIFVGWHADMGGDKLYPAGASVPLSADTVFDAVLISYATCVGASVRVTSNDVALRFTSAIAKSDYAMLVDILGEDAITFGTYITAKDYLYKTAHVFTIEALAAAGFDKYLDVVAGAFYKEDANNYYIAGSVAHILPENYSRAYSGIGYMKVTYSDGSVGTVYSDFHYIDNSRNIYKVVFSAYEDRAPEYPFIIPVGVHGNTYSLTHSPYTVQQLDAMKKYLDSVVSVDYTADSNGDYVYFGVAGQYYSTPWRVAYEIVDRDNAEALVTITPPAGGSIEKLYAIHFGGTRIVLTSDLVTITESTIVITHSGFSKPH